MSSDKENVAPGKKRRLSLSLSKKQKRSFDETSLEEIAALEKPHMAKNTEVSSKWAMKNLTEWFLDYNKRNPDLPCPESILTSSPPSKEELSKFLTIFIAETFFPRCPPVYDYCDVQYPPYYITSFPGDNEQCN